MESQWKGLTWGKGNEIKFASTDKFTRIGVQTADWGERHKSKFREIRSGLPQTSRQGESLVMTEEMEEKVSDSVQEKDLGGCDRTRAYDWRGHVTCLPMDCGTEVTHVNSGGSFKEPVNVWLPTFALSLWLTFIIISNAGHTHISGPSCRGEMAQTPDDPLDM